MKVSRNWLQKYFEKPLPSVEELSDALTFHSFEIEEAHGDLLDVKVLPDRAADCLSHRGIAREIAAVLDVPMVEDPFRKAIGDFKGTTQLEVSIEDGAKCLRYMGAVVHGVNVGPSPAWLKEALEAVGQRSINNVVDATNYVMLNIGQPLHAFDAAQLVDTGDGAHGTNAKKYSIAVRDSHTGEKITTLTGDEFELPEGIMLITDANAFEADAPIGIAGVKGGKAAGITTTTTDIIIESANFDGTSVRKASQKLKLWTDASQRYQNKISPELTAYGMRDVLALIKEVAGGELEGVVDVYPAASAANAPVSVTLSKINRSLGTSYEVGDVTKVFKRFDFSFTTEGELFTVAPPFERRDLTIPENLVEEVGRVLGYENIHGEPLPPLSSGADGTDASAAPHAPDQSRYNGIERIKDFLTERGFTEISTQTFAVAGDITLANPLDQTRPALRAGLEGNMRDALTRAANVAPRVLGPVSDVKLFEVGTIFKKDSEHLALVLGYKQLVGKQSAAFLLEVITQLEQEIIGSLAELPRGGDAEVIEVLLTNTNLELIGAEYNPRKIKFGAYKPFSIYPFALRDIAVWTPERTEEDEVANIIISTIQSNQTPDILARIDLFDRFSKTVDGKERISYAFRLVFESYQRTLSDEDLNPLMDIITAALNAKQNDSGEKWEVR